MNTVVQIRRPPKAARSVMDTVLLDVETANSWKIPPFQRPLRVNDKVRTIASTLEAEGGVISGVLTLAKLDSDKATYLLDGQHRREAFLLSGLPEAIADVRTMHFESMAEMGEEFVKLNEKIVMMRPDDILRGLEGSISVLGMVRKNCPYVGYDNIRRGDHSPVLSMSSVLKCWAGSATETPIMGARAAILAAEMSPESAKQLMNFLDVAFAAWGRDAQYARLWLPINLVLCMWLWRRLVLDRERGTRRYIVLNAELFRKGLMALSADAGYLDWLMGRRLGERDRSPAYRRIKDIFARRLGDEVGKKVLLPQPPWFAA